MRILVPALLAALGVSGPALAEGAADVPAPDRSAIRQVILDQLDAFHKQDAQRAFSFAAPDVQQKFGDPDSFMSMVRYGYQPVFQSQGVVFEDIRTVAGVVTQTVAIEGPDGDSVLALYIMEHETDGNWRIDGCLLAPDTGVGT